jgi:hypothetical protein
MLFKEWVSDLQELECWWILNHCIHIHNNLLLDYSIQEPQPGPHTMCQVPCKVGFVAKQKKEDWRLISQIIKTRKYARGGGSPVQQQQWQQ